MVLYRNFINLKKIYYQGWDARYAFPVNFNNVKQFWRPPPSNTSWICLDGNLVQFREHFQHMILTKHFIKSTRQVIYCTFKKHMLVLFLFMEFSSVEWWQTYIFKYFIICQKILLGFPIVIKCQLVFKYSSQVLYRFCSTQLLFLFLRW